MEHRPGRGGAQGLDRLPPHFRENPQRIHVGMLALARSHPDGREALEQLAAVEAFLTGVLQIPHLEVFVEVHEFLAAVMRKNRVRMRRALTGRNRFPTRRLNAETDLPGRARSSVATFCETLRK